MCVSARVDDNAGRLLASLLNPVDKIALVVGLPEIDFQSSSAAAALQSSSIAASVLPP